MKTRKPTEAEIIIEEAAHISRTRPEYEKLSALAWHLMPLKRIYCANVPDNWDEDNLITQYIVNDNGDIYALDHIMDGIGIRETFAKKIGKLPEFSFEDMPPGEADDYTSLRGYGLMGNAALYRIEENLFVFEY